MLIENIIDRIRLPFRKEKELYSSLREILGFYPHNIELYKRALMHRSAAKGSNGGRKGRNTNNERLEFLGDAILDAVVGDIVFRHFKGKREGFLTNTRSKIVQRETLNKLAQEMGIGRLIKSNAHNTAHNSYMGGNAFEALVGAIYLDRGYNACMKFMEKRILNHLINIDKVAYKEVNFKSKLLEWCQKNKVRVEFRMVDESKDESSPVFKAQAMIENVAGGEGKGYSKKESQQTAARVTLQRLRKEPQFIDAIFAAKTERTKMEEEPVSVAPDVEQHDDFLIMPAEGTENAGTTPQKQGPRSAQKVDGATADKISDDANAKKRGSKGDEPTREDIIAEAEAAAFEEANK